MATDNDDGINLLRACKEGDLQKVQHYIEEKNVSPIWNKKLIPEDLKRRHHPSFNQFRRYGYSTKSWVLSNPFCCMVQSRWCPSVSGWLRCWCESATKIWLYSSPLCCLVCTYIICNNKIRGGAIDAVQFLLTNFDINFKLPDQAGRVALHDAVDNGKLQVLEYLVAHIYKKEEDRLWVRQLRDISSK